MDLGLDRTALADFSDPLRDYGGKAPRRLERSDLADHREALPQQTEDAVIDGVDPAAKVAKLRQDYPAGIGSGRPRALYTLLHNGEEEPCGDVPPNHQPRDQAWVGWKTSANPFMQ